jgi:hypothetical protein
MAKPRRTHVASQCYIRGWADNGCVFVQAEDLAVEPVPASVGWRNAGWGADAGVSTTAEAMLQRVEDAAAPVLRETVAGERPNRRAIARTDPPAARATAISSRSENDK